MHSCSQGQRSLGGWAEVYRKDRTNPFRIEVALKEFNAGHGQWTTMPGQMIRKVALVQALREAFPASFAGLYDATEMRVHVDETTGEIITSEAAEVREQPKAAAKPTSAAPAKPAPAATATPTSAKPATVQSEAKPADAEEDFFPPEDTAIPTTITGLTEELQRRQWPQVNVTRVLKRVETFAKANFSEQESIAKVWDELKRNGNV